ncbi:MAG TPA: hypothetical protein PK357_03240 [Candidatus Pacearchaeota archaeon]|nr:hypothetical protein [Candidatus Pacearchaeota archaeon]
MKLTQLIKDFVSRKENAEVIFDLTKLSTEYYYDLIRRRYPNSYKSNVDYTQTLKKINDYIKKHNEFKKINPRDFSVELMKYLYEHRLKPGTRE